MIDASIPLRIKPAQILSLADLRRQQQEEEARAQQQRIGGLQEQALTRQARAQDRATQEEAALRSLPDDQWTVPGLTRVVGPDRAMALAKSLDGLKQTRQAGYRATKELVRDFALGLQALPTDAMRAEYYTPGRQALIAHGLITAADLPEQFDPAEFQQALSFGQAPAAAPSPVELNVDTTLVDPVTGRVIARGKDKPVEEPKAGTLEDYLPTYARDVARKPVQALTAADKERAKARWESAGRAAPASGGPTMWAKDSDGVVKLMTPEEIRARGASQPDTADMRNKVAGKKTAAIAVDAVRDLGQKILRRVGPAQRAEAVVRGVEAVFGNDPEFRTYQDSRMALAGTLAVEQQGSRVSDADVKALWLPMVPDAYRDTKESNELKWTLIDTMRGVTPTSDVPKVGNVKTFPNGRKGRWDGSGWEAVN